MTSTTKEEEHALQGELNNLRTKLTYVEDELQELTQQLTNKVGEVELLVQSLDQQKTMVATKEDELAEKGNCNE